MAVPLKRLEGKYEILEKLQEGGMGAIYKVRHRLLGELRVVKVLRPHLQGDPGLRIRFLAEARAATQLGHPNIAQIFDCSIDDDGVAYIVMELILGMTLEELLATVGPPPLPLTLEIARQGLRAIGHLHGHQVVHRDVSPDNLMLTRDVDGRPLVKLIDLGLAKEVEGSGRLTGAGVFLGKFRYAAPETFDDRVPGDPRRSDLYAFALVLYELLTGRFPIPGEDASSLIAGHLFRPPLDFALSDPEGRVPAAVRRAILRGLAKSPGERFADVESFAAALETNVDLDLSSPEVRYVLELTQDEDRRPSRIVRPPGSTQSRLNLQFEAEPTPAPATVDEDAPTRILRTVSPVDQPPRVSLTEVAPQRRQRTPEDGETLILTTSACPPPGALPIGPPSGEPGDVPGRDRPGRDRPGRDRPGHDRPAPVVTGAETRRLHSNQMRAMQADELTARARSRAQVEDFLEARELLGKALELIPDHPQAVALLASVGAGIEVAEQETQQLVRASRTEASRVQPTSEETITLVERPSMPETLHLSPSGDSSHLSPFGGTNGLRDAPGGVTPDWVAPDGVTPDGATPTAAPASGFPALDQVLRSIRALCDDGRAGEALKQLNRALREFGPQPALRTLRDELGEALLERDEEENSDSRRFEIAAPDHLAPTVLSAVPPDATPPGETPPAVRLHLSPSGAMSHLPPSEATSHVAEATIRGLSDATIRSFETPVQQVSKRRGPPISHPTLNMVAVGLVLAAIFAALGFLLTRDGTVIENGQLETQDVVAADLSPGSIAIDAVPWAEIVSLENPALEEAPPISPSRFTPVILRLPPGEYRITLRYPPTGQAEELLVRVDSDVRVEERVIFESLDAKAYFDRVGW